MSYTRKLLSDTSIINDLVSNYGYLTGNVYNVISKIIELCVSIIIIDEVINKYIDSNNIPQRVEININIPVISLSHDKTVDPCESLESIGCIASIGEGIYRVMTRRLMSRIFTLTTGGDSSITSALDTMNSPDIFVEIINKIENELISIIHDKIDARNISVDDIHLRLTSNHIVEKINEIIEHVEKFKDNNHIDKLILRSIPRVMDKEDIIEKYIRYSEMIKELSDIIEDECDMQREMEKIIEQYPSSFFSRDGNSIFSDTSDEHIIIKNMKRKIRDVFSMLSSTIDMYGKYMDGINESVRELPYAEEEFIKIFENDDMDAYKYAWKSIGNNLKLSLIQIKNLSTLTGSVRKILKQS